MSSKTMKLTMLAVSVGALIATVGYLKSEPASQHATPAKAPVVQSKSIGKVEEKAKAKALLKVSVTSVTVGSNSAVIDGYGEVAPRYNLALNSKNSGEVVYISPSFESGSKVKKGDILVKIDSSSYENALEQAKSNLEQAKVDLLEEIRQSDQAKLEWERSGIKGKPESDLVLRKPYLSKAKQDLKTAEASVKKAKEDLDSTVIRSPFDALVISRNVQPGSYITSSSDLGEIINRDRFDVAVPISDGDWESIDLDDSKIEKKEQLVKISTNHRGVGAKNNVWEGYVSRYENHLNDKSRTRDIIVSVDSPLEKGFLTSMYVRVSFNSPEFENSLVISEDFSSLDGEYWYVDDNNKLNKFKPEILYRSDWGGDMIIKNPFLDKRSINILKMPSIRYEVGQEVEVATNEASNGKQ